MDSVILKEVLQIKEQEEEEVDQHIHIIPSITPPGLNFLTPVPSQILSTTNHNEWPFHIEFNYEATVSYIWLDKACSHTLTNLPNSQIS